MKAGKIKSMNFRFRSLKERFGITGSTSEERENVLRFAVGQLRPNRLKMVPVDGDVAFFVELQDDVPETIGIAHPLDDASVLSEGDDRLAKETRDLMKNLTRSKEMTFATHEAADHRGLDGSSGLGVQPNPPVDVLV